MACSLAGSARLGAALLFAAGAMLLSASVIYVVCCSSALLTLRVGSACARYVVAAAAVPAIVLGGLALFAYVGVWRLRSWAGSLAICVSVAMVFLSALWVPKVQCLGSLDPSLLVPLASLASAVCIAISWKCLR